MTDRRRIEYRSDLDTREFEQGARTMRDRFRDMGRALQENGIVGFGQLSQAVGYSARDLIDMGRRAVTGALDLAKAGEAVEQVARSFNEIFGPAADNMRTKLDETRRSMGLSRGEAESMLLPIGQMATNAGFAADESGRLAGQLFTMAGDVAAFNPLIGDSSEALGAMQAALRGEFDPLERFGSKLSAARVQAEAARLRGVDPLNEALSDQQLQIKAVVSLLEQDFAPAMGTLEDREGTLTDATLELEAAWKDFKDTMGREIAPGVADGANTMADAVEGDLLGAAKNALVFLSGEFDRGLRQLSLGTMVDAKNRVLGLEEAFRQAESATESWAKQIDLSRSSVEDITQPYLNMQMAAREAAEETAAAMEQMASRVEASTERTRWALNNIVDAWNAMHLTPKKATLDIIAFGIGDDRPREEDGRHQAQSASAWNAINGSPQ